MCRDKNLFLGSTEQTENYRKKDLQILHLYVSGLSGCAWLPYLPNQHDYLSTEILRYHDIERSHLDLWPAMPKRCQ